MSEQPIRARAPMPWWWRAGLYAIILWSAAFVVFPPVRAMGALASAMNALFVVFAILQVRREMRTGLLGKTVTEIHAVAKSGVRLTEPLETAAVLAFVLTSIVRMFWM
jgi:hypothetical protein